LNRTALSPNFRWFFKITALHLAATEGYHRIVNYLLMKGAKLDVTDRWGNTPLEDAQRNKHQAVIEAIRTFNN